MTTLRVLSRAALICNGCFLMALAILHIHLVMNQQLVSLIIIMGFGLSVIFNVIVNTCFGILLMRGVGLRSIPSWLRIINLIFLVIQLIYILRWSTRS